MEEKFHRAQRRGGENYSAAGEALRLPPNVRRRLDRVDFVSSAAVAGAAKRFDVYHSGLGKDPRPVLLREIQIVEIQCVLCAIAATHHAATTANASRSRRTFSPKERIGKGLVTQLSRSRLED